MSKSTLVLPKVIVFSSSERKSVRDRLINALKDVCIATSWDKGFFPISQTAYSAFQHLANQYDFAIIILSPDDMVKCRGKAYMQPRDNLLFELGVSFQFPQKRIIIFSHEDCRIPGDIDGFQRIVWTDPMSDFDFSNKIIKHITDITNEEGLLLTWDECMSAISQLHTKLTRSAHGFHFHSIVAVEGGGGIPADLLARECGHRTPIFILNADRSGGKGKESFDIPMNKYVLEGIKSDYENHKSSCRYNILVVDNVARSGANITKAKEYLRNSFKEANITIKSAVVFLNSALDNTSFKENKIDYYGCEKEFTEKTLLKLIN